MAEIQRSISQRDISLRRKVGAAVSITMVAAIILLLFVFSGQNSDESSALSGRVTAFIIRLLRLEELGLPLGRAEFFVRKAAHFTIYSVLGVGLCGTAQCLLLRMRFFAASLAGIFIAAMDEFHQLFVPGRSGSPLDVLLDYCGVAAGYLVCFCAIHIVLKISKKSKNRSDQ